METSEPAVPAVPATPRDPKEVVQSILSGLGIEATIEQQMLDSTVLLRIATAEPGRLIGRHGQTLSQLQFLVNRILLRADQSAPRVQIDCENYRTKQRDDVLDKVKESAEKVRRWGEPIHIGPFNAADRHTIQQYFATDTEIEAVSENGEEGGMKKMTLRLKS